MSTNHNNVPYSIFLGKLFATWLTYLVPNIFTLIHLLGLTLIDFPSMEFYTAKQPFPEKPFFYSAFDGRIMSGGF